MENSSAENWFLLTTKPKSEQRAAENLASQKIEVYFPKVKQVKKRQGKKVVLESPYSPIIYSLNWTFKKMILMLYALP